MKIRVETQDNAIQFEEQEDKDIYEMMNIIGKLLLAMGFHPNAIKEGFFIKAEEFENE